MSRFKRGIPAPNFWGPSDSPSTPFWRPAAALRITASGLVGPGRQVLDWRALHTSANENAELAVT